MDRLSSDLVPYISDPPASLILASVVSTHWSRLPNDSIEEGTVTLEVQRTFRSGSLRSGEHFGISGRRPSDPNIRFLNLRDQWNAIPFAKGDLLLMAVRAATSADVVPLAAIQVQAVDAPDVGALRRAVEIEQATDATQRTQMLSQALESPQDLLLRFALDDLGRRKAVPREQGAEMIIHAIFSNIPYDSRLTLVNELTGRYYYQYELGADPVNKLVIETLASLLAAEQDPKKIGLWSTFLFSSLAIHFSKDPQKDNEVRDRLIRSIPTDVRQKVPGKLTIAAQRNPPDPRIPSLMKAWEAALQ